MSATDRATVKGDVVLVARLWVEPARVADYERFEREAAAVLAAHGARIERVIRRAPDASPDEPFEVHVVRFPDEAALLAWREDPATISLAATRDEVLVRTEVFRGKAHPGYGPDVADADDIARAEDPGGSANGMEAASGTEVPALSERWEASPECLTTTYVFGTFADAIAFMGDCVDVIDALDHHPDWSNAHRRVHVSLTTHSVGHVTDLDRRLAAALDRIHAARVR